MEAEYAKRVVGGPGDRIRIADQQVYVDGIPIDEPYKQHIAPVGSYADPFRDDYPPLQRVQLDAGETGLNALWYEDHVVDGEILVPDGRYFVLGDNRDFSSDSRYFGLVDGDRIRAQVLYVYWSPDLSRLGTAVE
jgi:signal peptidase I